MSPLLKIGIFEFSKVSLYYSSDVIRITSSDIIFVDTKKPWVDTCFYFKN